MSVKKRYIRHGDIVEIKLPHLNRFSYCKVVEPKQLTRPINLPHFIRVYSDTYKQPIPSTEMLNRKLLLAPFYIVGGSAAITKFGWRVVSNEVVSEAEEWIPDTKEGWPLFSNLPEKWGYKQCYSTELIFSEYERVSHLDDATGKNVEVIPFLIELELLKNEGKDIRTEYGINNWLEQTIYNSFIQLPVFTKLPEEIKGRAIQ